jgi:SNF2 family DNA or RNA helicase
MPSETTPPPFNDKEKRVYKKLQESSGLVLAHGLGTGKTRTSLQVANAIGKPASVVVPAALQDNYKKELNRWLGKVPSNFHIQSQQGAAVSGLKNPNDQTLIVDEAHRAREPQSKLLTALQKSTASKRLLLTASPVYNHPADLAPLVNLAANKQVLPENRNQFAHDFIENKEVKPGLLGGLLGIQSGQEQSLKDVPKLRNAIKKYVDYQGGRTEGFPSSSEQVVKVPLNGAQQDIYNTIMNKAPMWVRWKVKAGLPPGRGELQALQAFLTGGRQVSNSTYDFVRNKAKADAPKIDTAVNYLKQQLDANPRYKAVIYSNYLNSGLQPYKDRLAKANIPYGEFSGEMNPTVRSQTIRDYNANKLRALLISSAGAEGLDLKGTRLLQILEPHFNREKEKQIVGRAIRYQSHAGLPPEEQNVLIQRYLSQPKGNWFDRLLGRDTVRGTDEYISDLADRKEKLNQQLLQQIAKYGG